MTPLEKFTAKLQASLQAGTFVKCTLSAPTRVAGDLRNVYLRPVELSEGPRIAVTWRHQTRDVAKNFTVAETLASVSEMLRDTFQRADLFTTTGDWRLFLDEHSPGKLKASRPAFAQAAPQPHDATKLRVLPVAEVSFLQALGVTNAQGEARPGMVGKLRQIERFSELLRPLLERVPAPVGRPLRVVDMGAGKGYLTFALAELLRRSGREAEIIGVERRGDLVKLTNEVAQQHGYQNLRFVEGAIGTWEAGTLDVLVALHACDTATDDALFAGLQGEAALLVVAPCCHQELRPQMQVPPGRAAILRHGILREREAEALTDALRAVLLEAEGYRTQIFEFISSEHTGKNTMLSAERRGGRKAAALEEWHALEEAYGLRTQRLAAHLGLVPGGTARAGLQVQNAEML